jgi:CRISPR/Cas system CSM-associated protein Csm3 (group 7 of RAMP superfamily)
MSNDRLNNRHQRNIYKRIIVKGMLILDTPTCLGSGNSDSLTDLALLRDSVDEDKALLTGASIAGALRNYLHEYDPSLGLATLLFGANRQDDQGDQSPLIVNDSISTEKIDIELRDGVRIDGNKGVAVDGAKYDFELLSAGTQFPLFFELLIEKKYQDLQKQSEYENNLKQGLAIALSGFEKGEIAIGMKKRRGFGRCKVENWQVWEFDLRNSQHRLAWLTFDRELGNEYTVAETLKEGKIEHIFDAVSGDQRDRFAISAKFSPVGSMLIRSGQSLQKDKDGKYRKSPDAVHLKSNRSDKSESIISGKSLAGVLRHRAVRIVKTLNPNIVIPEGKDRQPEIIEKIFGFVAEDEKRKDVLKAQASRLIVEEKVIEKPTELVQPRIAINRFTGGAMHGALFDAQPVFSGEVELKLELWNPKDKDNEYEIGLLLLLLKDLWTGDLPIGSESSIGRGRLQGLHADITYQGNTWTIQGKDSLTITPDIAKETLESYVQQLVKKVEVKS